MLDPPEPDDPLLDAVESPEDELESELLLEEVLFPGSEDPELPLPLDELPLLLAVSEGEELDPESESLELPEFPELLELPEDPDVLEESELFELEEP